jgi:Acyl CoA:acetate/3-ketoacid CoA transferase, beta subunit
MSAPPYSPAEQMACCAARLIRNGDVLYVGVGLPTAAALLAKLTHAPEAWVIFETGILRSRPFSLPLGVDTIETQENADVLSDVLYINALAQRGRVDLGFIGGGQIDRHGNVNSNAVGPYRTPTYRFPGCGGANDIASLCSAFVVLMPQKKTRFPERVDFVSCPGFLDGTPGAREKAGLPAGTGPRAVITDMGLFRFEHGTMTLEQVHRGLGCTEEKIQENLGWPLATAADIASTEPPTAAELRCLREQVDPRGRIVSGLIA